MRSAGEKAPSFTLQTLNGKHISLADLSKHGRALLVFFKTECPTCQYTLPFVERLHKALPDAPIIAIAQNPAAETSAFAKRFNLTLPILLDEKDYAVSRAYGLATVPSLIVVDKDGTILFATEGWAKDDFEILIQKMKPPSGPSPVVFQPQESVQAFKAG